MARHSRSIRVGIRVLCSIALLYVLPASAANWLLIQRTEPATAPAYRPFGFMGIEYRRTGDSQIAAGPFKGQPLVPNRIGPRLENASELQFSHVRLGLRGRLFDGKLNYLVSALAGDNGISRNGTPNVKLTDLSFTFNPIPHVRVRIGQFKQPGSEEGLQLAVLRDYVYLTGISRQIINERFFDSDGTPKNDVNVFDGPLSGWRDTGIQSFDTFRTGAWAHTCAFMVGIGTGSAICNDFGSGRPDGYLFWSSERIFAGKGAFRDGLKLTGWYQNGERELRTGAEQKTKTFDCKRYGLGTVFRRSPWRIEAEWVKADGMVFNGTDGGAAPGSVSNNGNVISGFNVLPEGEADGWYLDGGAIGCSMIGSCGPAMIASTEVPTVRRPSAASRPLPSAYLPPS